MSKLHVDQKSVKNILSEKSSLYLIPEYQRPYEWDENKCRTLWDDILEFAMPDNNPDNFDGKEEYFLGSIVTFKNESFLEVIDGQQRITTLLLLLRAVYKKLEPAKEELSLEVKRQIEPCIWQTDEFSKPDKEKIRIDTKVATDKDRNAFIQILKTGDVVGQDIYSRNYKYFIDWIDEYALTYPIAFYKICVRILNNCILLPIECESQDVALRIFTTLNDRGMPLSDSDIFKAQLYKYYSGTNKQDFFIEKWQELSETCDNIAKSNKSNQNVIDEIFTLYMYWLRAKDGIKDTTVPGLRKYFEQNKYEKLKRYQTVEDVIALSDFWRILSDKEIDNPMGVSEETLKYVHCLEYFPNAFWKYNLTIFFFANKDSDNKLEEIDFCEFVKQTLAFCYISYIINPTISKLKNISIPAFVDIANKQRFKYQPFDKQDFSRSFHSLYTQTKLMIKPMLLWEAYQIPEQSIISKNTKLEIEHILPKNWKSGSYKEWNRNDAEEYLEKIGNKILLDKKTNIQAGDGFFGIKKEKWYKDSVIKAVNKLVTEYPHDEWIK
ncbi:MAG: DUF262 domain-containing HNH endonuclease family protein, partial [Prevotellaceae bacterium]|nr:DUF262 domain-containing HNH endonuclease family protein [Prevotellaceae bacterium]